MSPADWSALPLFMTGMLVIVAFLLAVSGHFPAQVRGPEFRAGSGLVILWASIACAAAAAAVTIAFAWHRLPLPYAVIGGGLMILFAPYALHPLPDRIVNGQPILAALAGACAIIGLAMWRSLS